MELQHSGIVKVALNCNVIQVFLLFWYTVYEALVT